MTRSTPYQIPTGSIRTEFGLKRSRFMTTMGRAAGRPQAAEFISKIRAAYPDATHHCWAYIAASPFDANQIAMSDDGEPRGTAGRPMLNILQQRRIEQVVAVVNRYFGGVKLGTGGLVRAYSTSVQQGLQILPLKVYSALKRAEITLPYSFEDRLRQLLDRQKVKIKEVVYQDSVILRIEFPEDLAPDLEQQVRDQTRGNAHYASGGF